MRWEIIVIIGIGILILVGGYMASKQDVKDIRSNQEKAVSSQAKSLNNSFQVSRGISKQFIANESRIIIRQQSNNETLLDLKLLSDSIEWGLVAGGDIRVAEFWLYDFKNGSVNPFDTIRAYNLKDNNKSLAKNFKFKYGIDTLNCENNSGICENNTAWTEFNNISEIPFKPIRIGLYTNTNRLERVEWIPEARGFNFTEWAVWDVSTASYDNVNFSVTTQTNFPNDIFFSENGSIFYIVERTGDSIYQYNMTNPWNVSSAVYSGFSFNISAQGGEPRGLFINSSGTRMYMVDQTANRIFSYTLSQPWNVSSANYDNVNFSVAQDTAANQVFFNGTGEKMFVLSIGNDRVYQYTLSNAWNVSSATYDNVNFSVSSLEGTGSGLYIRSDGLKWWIIGTAQDRVYQFNMSQAWNLSSASYENVNFSVNSQAGTPVGLFFNKTGTKMFISDAGGPAHRVYQYSMTDTIFPNWSLNHTNSTTAGWTINHTVNWTDNIDLSGFIFSFDNGNGSFLNDTWVSMIGLANQSNATKNANSTVGSTIRWMFYANDSVNNVNVTSTFQYTTTAQPAGNCYATTSNGDLYVPTGCTYYIPKGSEGYIT